MGIVPSYPCYIREPEYPLKRANIPAMAPETSSISEALGSKKISRRSIVAGIAALGVYGFARNARAAETRPLAERLAAYAAALRYEDLDPATIERVKSHVIDTLGCGIAAFDERPVRVCREIAQSVQGAATIIGTTRKTSPDLAAFANGAAGRYYELNDIYVGKVTSHPSDHIAPCIAVAEAERASAHDLITAIALAYEIDCRLVDALDLTARGWDSPVFSLPAVALAAGKLMKLDAAKLTEAVNLAINDHIAMGQTRAQVLSDWKGLADGEASRNAVFAALLARDGLTGPAPIFEGRLGLFKQVSGEASIDVGKFGGRGNSFRINRCGIKAYPAVVYTQTAIVAAPAVTARIGDAVPTRITAILADGQRISREVNDIPGFAGKPMQRPDIDRKFRGNIGKRWPRQKTDAVLESLWVVENTQNIGALLATLTV